MFQKRPRLGREFTTVQAMIHLYCRKMHGGPKLCGGCQALEDYARERLDHCPFQEGKTTCVQCPVHCYRPQQREQVKVVMRTVGPRMIYRHPILSLCHWIDGFRRKPLGRDGKTRVS